MNGLPGPRSYIHYNPERTDYAITADELERLRRGGSNLWKDVFLVSISLSIPLLINAIGETRGQQTFILTLPMFLNYLVGLVSAAASVVSGVAWYRTHESAGAVVRAIKEKPRLEIFPAATAIGPLPVAQLGPGAAGAPPLGGEGGAQAGPGG